MTRIVGIDLGTTHTALASGGHDTAAPDVFTVDQWVSAGAHQARPLLPSFLFHPPTPLPSDPFGDAPWVIGEWARARGRETPGRVITSAKSWLSHTGVDRTADILPWGSEASDVPRISPVEASARLLRHLVTTWDAAHPREPLARQEIVLTVPASFDEVARELTVRAAEEAGLRVRLLEEPQAAFYDFLQREGDRPLAALFDDAPTKQTPGSSTEPTGSESEPVHVLVCDVGGGTTDLSLIRVTRGEQGVDLERVAVGKHLLLGGDNFDLALAHQLERRLAPEGGKLDPARFLQLVQQARSAKETLLGPEAPESVRLSVAGAGSALVGQTQTVEVTRQEVEDLVLGGFLPAVSFDEPAAPRSTAALVAFGLPYERDPAITRHIVQFLRRHLGAAAPRPQAVLYNGGPFRSERLRRHLHGVLEAALGHRLVELHQPDPDLAVARGAVAFGRAVHGLLPSIASGAAHGYYIGVAEQEGGETRRALCIVPRGAKEGQRHRVERGLTLTVGRAARFELYAKDSGPVHAPGELVELDDDFLLLPPIATTFEEPESSASTPSSTTPSSTASSGSAPSGSAPSRVPVALEGELSALGTVDLSCVALTDERRYRLAFELRGTESPQSARGAGPRRDGAGAPSSGSARATSARLPTSRLDDAYEAIQRVFGKGRKDVKEREVKDLLRTLERLLGERRAWNLEVNRSLFDVIGPLHKSRRRSPDHERVFWLLASYTLRPGMGHPLDPGRVALLADLLTEGLAFPQHERTWQQLFIAWRRLAPGLSERHQTRLRDQIDPFLAPASAKLPKPKGFRPLSLLDALEAASWLERVDVRRRGQLCDWILERTWTDRDPRLWAALGRLGTRVPLYASAHHVLPARHAEELLDHLLREPWDEIHTAPWAATLLARRTDDRARDVPSALRAEVARRLEAEGAPAEWVRSVAELVPPEQRDQTAVFGEELPVGLTLA